MYESAKIEERNRLITQTKAMDKSNDRSSASVAVCHSIHSSGLQF